MAISGVSCTVDHAGFMPRPHGSKVTDAEPFDLSQSKFLAVCKAKIANHWGN
jgi:hypothetical protein